MSVHIVGRRKSDPPPERAFADLLAVQNARWDGGERVMIEELVAAHPEVAGDPTRLIPLILNEWMLCWESGIPPVLAEYQARFPLCAVELTRQYAAQLAFEQVGDESFHHAATQAPNGLRPVSHVPDLPGYRILDEIGRGGMGVVYRAEHLALRRVVAVKFLLAGRTARDAQVQRFLNEGKLLARLHHPNVVQVFEVGSLDGSPYLVMEFVSGEPLDRRVGGRSQAQAEVLRTVEVLARAVAHSHEHGILHRDLKPANVLVTTDGVPKLTDFGLAKALDGGDGPELTRTGDVMGTPSYMAPEQAAGKPAGVPTDVYGLGAILYELLTGRPPFEGESTIAVVKKVLETPARSPRQWRPDVSRDLETICLKCLEKEPAKRYPTAAALADDLRRVQLGEVISARPVGPFERGWRWCRRNRGVAITAASVFFILLTATAVSLGFAGEARRQAGRAEGNATAAQRQRDAAVEARWRGMLNEVAGERHGRRPGQRAVALAKLREALALARDQRPLSAEDKLRFAAEATTAYGLTELVPADEWDGWPPDTIDVRFSPDLSRYVRRSNLPLEIRHGSTGELQHGFKKLNAQGVFVPIGSDHLFTVHSIPNSHDLTLARRAENAEKRWPAVWEHVGVRDFAIRADGSVVVFSRGWPIGPLVVVDGETGAVRHELKAKTALSHHAFHPTKPWVLTRWDRPDEEGLAIVDTSRGKVVAETKVDFFPVAAAWRPDGRRFAVAGEDRIVRVFDDRLSELCTPPTRLLSAGPCLCYSPSGEYLVTYDWSRHLRVCDGTSGQLLLLESTTLADGVLRLAADNTLTPEQDGTRLRRHRLPERSVKSLSLALCPNNPFERVVWNSGRSLFVASHGGGYELAVLCDGATGEVLGNLPDDHMPLWFEANDAAFLTVIDVEPSGKKDMIYRWPVDRAARTVGPPQLVVTQPRGGTPGASANRSVVAFANVVYQSGLGREKPVDLDLSKHRGGDDIRAAAVSNDGLWAVVCSHGQGSCCLYDLQTRTWKTELWDGPGQATFSPNGSTLAVFGQVSGRLFRVSDWTPVRDLPGSEGAFSPDGKLLAVSGRTRTMPVGTVELIETATGRTVARFEHPTRSQVDPVGFGPDPAKLYLRVTETRTLDVWDLRDVRRQLKADFDLDWDWPAFPPAPEAPPPPSKWSVKGIVDWNRALPKRTGVNWNRVFPQIAPPTLRKDR